MFPSLKRFYPSSVRRLGRCLPLESQTIGDKDPSAKEDPDQKIRYPLEGEMGVIGSGEVRSSSRPRNGRVILVLTEEDEDCPIQ